MSFLCADYVCDTVVEGITLLIRIKKILYSNLDTEDEFLSGFSECFKRIARIVHKMSQAPSRSLLCNLMAVRYSILEIVSIVK